MRDFDKLSSVGRGRRLRVAAANALADSYGIEEARLRLVTIHSFNAFFRVDTQHGPFALRIGDACRIHPVGVEDVEARWLNALDAGGFGTATTVRTTGGQAWTLVSQAGVPKPRVCTLFTWVRGSQLGRSVDADMITETGRLLARMHQHAASLTFEVPTELEARSAVYFAGENLVATYPHPDAALFREAIDRVQRHIDKLWHAADTAPHLLHGDFGPGNLMRYRNRLAPIDFQDLRFGFAQQDVAITVADLERSDGELVEPFLAGYRQVGALSDLEAQHRALHGAGRDLNIMNLALHAPQTPIASAFDRCAERVRTWMTTSSGAG